LPHTYDQNLHIRLSVYMIGYIDYCTFFQQERMIRTVARVTVAISSATIMSSR
jgi:hypothetical protein